MADRMPASIEIGGTLPASRIADLARAADEDGAGLEWGCPAPSAAELLGSLTDRRADRAGPVKLHHDEASCGLLDSLQGFCHANGLPYRQHTSGRYGYDTCLTYWQPGWPQPRECYSDQAGTALVSLDTLRASVDAGLTLADVIQAQAPPDVPPLSIEWCEACREATVPGVLWPVNADDLTGRGYIEMCDECAVYDGDIAAAEALASHLGLRLQRDSLGVPWLPRTALTGPRSARGEKR